MKSQNTKATAAQGANVAVEAAPATQVNAGDLMAMIQAFMAQQAGTPTPAPAPVSVPVKTVVKSKAKASSKATPAKQEAPAVASPKGVQVHKLENSFFVYGEQAPAKLAKFFEKKPHLNRGFKAHNIVGVGTVNAFWFGGRQYAKVMKAIA